MGNGVWIVNNYVYKTGATGILVFNGRTGTTFQNIFIVGNSVGDSSQNVVGNAAIQLNPTSNAMQNVIVSGNNVWDDQGGLPTTEVMLSITNGSSTGTITGLTVTGNTHTNTINAAAISNSMPAGDLIGFMSTPLNPMTFAKLDACSSSLEGLTASVTDSNVNTAGSNIAGGGTNHVLGYCNGTSWVVASGAGSGGGMVFP